MLGFDVGQRFCITVAERLKRGCDADMIARLNGDKFCLFSDATISEQELRGLKWCFFCKQFEVEDRFRYRS